jgi:hypothetical protein
MCVCVCVCILCVCVCVCVCILRVYVCVCVSAYYVCVSAFCVFVCVCARSLNMCVRARMRIPNVCVCVCDQCICFFSSSCIEHCHALHHVEMHTCCASAPAKNVLLQPIVFHGRCKAIFTHETLQSLISNVTWQPPTRLHRCS